MRGVAAPQHGVERLGRPVEAQRAAEHDHGLEQGELDAARGAQRLALHLGLDGLDVEQPGDEEAEEHGREDGAGGEPAAARPDGARARARARPGRTGRRDRRRRRARRPARPRRGRASRPTRRRRPSRRARRGASGALGGRIGVRRRRRRRRRAIVPRRPGSRPETRDLGGSSGTRRGEASAGRLGGRRPSHTKRSSSAPSSNGSLTVALVVVVVAAMLSRPVPVAASELEVEELGRALRAERVDEEQGEREDGALPHPADAARSRPRGARSGGAGRTGCRCRATTRPTTGQVTAEPMLPSPATSRQSTAKAPPIESARKNTQATLTKANTARRWSARAPAVAPGSGRPRAWRASARARSSARPTPCMPPQNTNVQPAPCHRPAEQERDHEVHVGAAAALAVAAQRDVEVVAQPAGQRDVPAPPEVLDGARRVRRVEVLGQLEAEEQGDADGDVAVGAEVAVDLHRVGEDPPAGSPRTRTTAAT